MWKNAPSRARSPGKTSATLSRATCSPKRRSSAPTRSIRGCAESAIARRTIARLVVVAAICLVGSFVWQPPTTAQTYPGAVPELTPKPPPRDRFSLRLGFLHSALFNSNQGRPFFYLDTGLRYKTDQNYVDLKLPAFVAGIDFLSFQLQTLLGFNEPFNLFEFANEPIQYAAYLEPAHIRLGQTFLTEFPGGAPLRLTGGVFALTDFLFFQLALANQDPEEFDDIDDPSAIDPFVVAAGGFVAIGGDAPISEWDLALGIGPDVFQNNDYLPSSGIVIYTDLEVQIDPLDDIGAYIRTRVSTYTHTSPIVWSIITTYGVALSLL